MKPRRVIIFSLAYYPRFVGGAEVAIKEHTDRMRPDEFSFDLVTLRFDRNLPAQEKIGNVTVHRVGFSSVNPGIADIGRMPLAINKFLFPILGCLKARSLHRAAPYDAAWGMMARYAGLAALFFTWLHPGVRFVLSLQEGDIEGDPVRYLRRRALWVFAPLFTAIYRRADAVAAESVFLGKLATTMGFRGEPALVPNGVDVSIFAREYPERELAALASSLGKAADTRFVITTSRLVKKNAVDDVIRALKFLPASVQFLVLGIGPDKAMLEKLAQSEGVADRVRFLGHIEHKEMPRYLKIADVFVRPSLSEGMGNSFIEAMAAGIPIIGTPVGGIPDFLHDGTTGLVCAVRDPQNIAEKIRRLLSEPALYAAIVESARKLATTEYDWHLLAEKMRRVLSPSPPTPA